MNLRRLSAALLGSLVAGAALFAQAPQPGNQTVTPKREARAEKRAERMDLQGGWRGRGRQHRAEPGVVEPLRGERAERQQKRIAQGVASGQLTPKETARLERQEARIDKDIAKAEADGKITKREAGKIEREQNRESRRIKRQKHDAQTRK